MIPLPRNAHHFADEKRTFKDGWTISKVLSAIFKRSTITVHDSLSLSLDGHENERVPPWGDAAIDLDQIAV